MSEITTDTEDTPEDHERKRRPAFRPEYRGEPEDEPRRLSPEKTPFMSRVLAPELAPPSKQEAMEAQRNQAIDAWQHAFERQKPILPIESEDDENEELSEERPTADQTLQVEAAESPEAAEAEPSPELTEEERQEALRRIAERLADEEEAPEGGEPAGAGDEADIPEAVVTFIETLKMSGDVPEAESAAMAQAAPEMAEESDTAEEAGEESEAREEEPMPQGPDETSWMWGQEQSADVPPAAPTPPPGGGFYPPPGGGMPPTESLSHDEDDEDEPYAAPTTAPLPASGFESKRGATGYERAASRAWLTLLVGYFVGKRVGANRMESKMKPIEEKLTKQVNDLYDEAWQAKERIKKLSKQKRELEDREFARQQQERFEQPGQPAAEVAPLFKQQPDMESAPAPRPFGEISAVPSPQAMSESREPMLVPTAPELSPAYPGYNADIPAEESPAEPEASLSAEHAAQESSHGGMHHGEVGAAGFEVPVPEVHIGERQLWQPELSTEANVHPEAREIAIMPDARLIEAAKAVHVGGVSIEEFYRRGDIDAEGVRRVMIEHARGGSVERVLDAAIQATELRRGQSQEYLKQSPGSGMPSGGVQTYSASDLAASSMLPADDQSDYPYEDPQHLLTAYDEQTVTKKHHHTVAAITAVAGIAVGVVAALLLL